MTQSPRHKRAKRSAALWTACAVVALAGVFLRVWRLASIPGINGDEAWYGAKALRILAGEPIVWRTPTTPWLNPFYIALVMAAHLILAPSELALRAPALISGLSALAFNYFAARRFFGRATANVSTVALAALPVAIVYSRIGWDAAQCIPVSTLLLYASLAVARASRPRPYVLLCVLLYMAAVLIHPVNAIAGVFPLAGVWFRYGHRVIHFVSSGSRVVRLGKSCVVTAIVLVAAALARVPIREFDRVFGSLPSHLIRPTEWAQAARGFVDLFSGVGAYRHIAGSPTHTVYHLVVFSVLLAGAAFVFCRLMRHQTRSDRILWFSTAGALLAFYAFTGPMGFWHARERYALFLVPPVTLCFSRSLLMLGAWVGPRSRAKLLWGAAAFAALLVIDCYANVFVFIGQTGGRAWRTFAAAERDPKFEAARHILSRLRDPGGATVYAQDWWVRTPCEYLAVNSPGIEVTETKQLRDWDELAGQSATRPVWLLLYPDTKPFDEICHAMIAQGVPFTLREFRDFGGNPVVAAVGLRD